MEDSIKTEAHGEVFKLPHGSSAPIVMGFGLFLVFLGLADPSGRLGTLFLGVGLMVTIAGFYLWLHGDVTYFRENVSTGPRNGWWGMIFFLCTEVMLFGALFTTYFNHRMHTDGWTTLEEVHHLPIVATGINTIILLASGATMHVAHGWLRKGNKRGFEAALVVTLVLGAIFIAGQIVEYRELVHEGLTPATDAFGSTFYALTGTHGAHVMAGLVFLAICLARSRMGQFTAEKHVAVETAALYWHFVDAVWVVLYAVVYLNWF